MFKPDWLILRILHRSFEIDRPKGHWSEVVVHLYIYKHMRLYLLRLISKTQFVFHLLHCLFIRKS